MLQVLNMDIDSIALFSYMDDNNTLHDMYQIKVAMKLSYVLCNTTFVHSKWESGAGYINTGITMNPINVLFLNRNK